MEMMDSKTIDVEDSVCDPSCSASSSLREADLGAGGALYWIFVIFWIGKVAVLFFCCT